MGLFSEFKASNKVEWEAAISSSLKGKPLKSLNYSIGEIEFPVIQMEEEVNGSGSSLNFEGTSDVVDKQPVKLVSWLRIDREFRLNSIRSILDDLEARAISNVGFEIFDFSEGLLEELLTEIEKRKIEKIHFFLPGSGFQQAEEILTVLVNCSFPANRIGIISPDIISLLLAAGDNLGLVSWLENVQIRFPGVQCLLFDSNSLISRGLYPYEELSIMFEMLLELRGIADHLGWPLDKVFRHSSFRLSPGDRFMEGISKIRIWDSVGNAILQKLEPNKGLKITSELVPGKYSMGVFDVENNLLRQSSQMMVGFFAGTNIFHIYPYDESRESSSLIGNRTSSSLFFLLGDEAKLTLVDSPLRGCHFLDHLNESLGKKSWELFQCFQEEGGMFSSKTFNDLLVKSEERKALNQKKYLKREIPKVGSNLFPNTGERIPTEKEAYVQRYLDDVESISRGLDRIRLSNSKFHQALILMVGNGSKRFAEANSMGNILGSLGIDVKVIEISDLNFCNPDDFEFLVLVGIMEDLDKTLIETCENAGFKKMGVRAPRNSVNFPEFFKPGFILDPNDPLDEVLVEILKNG